MVATKERKHLAQLQDMEGRMTALSAIEPVGPIISSIWTLQGRVGGGSRDHCQIFWIL